MSNKNPELKILILEDVPTDAELTEHELRKAGISFSSRRVDTREGFVRELDEFAPDLIFADYKLPAFDGLSALDIAKEKSPDVPFIFITGAMGEEFAVETLKRGATDYVLKDRLFRLPSVVTRALQEKEERIKRRWAEEELKQKLDEVERINRLMVGRELKMEEMRKEIKRLQERVKELEEELKKEKG